MKEKKKVDFKTNRTINPKRADKTSTRRTRAY
jgi:hypothetical protein